jgi:hypothetical protein
MATIVSLNGKPQRKLIKEFHIQCGRTGRGAEVKEAILDYYGVADVKALSVYQLTGACAGLEKEEKKTEIKSKIYESKNRHRNHRPVVE